MAVPGGGGGGVDAVTADFPLENVGDATNVEVAVEPAEQESDVIVWDTSGTPGWRIRQLTADDIAAGFSIESFTGGETVEVGATVTNPTFAASYSSLPTSAAITNTDGTDSPLTLTTPFTAGTVTGAFTHAAVAVVTFTLTAVQGGNTKTASQTLNFYSRAFAGIGTAGASSATASGTSAVLNGGDGTLPNAGLSASIVGETFGPFAPSTQKLYVLCPHTGSPHTWKDPATGFAFAMNAPTTFSFTNVEGAALSYDLYESTNLLIASAQTVQCVT